MVSATILSRCLWVNNPGWEVVQLECSDGETFRSEKFRTIRAAWIGSNKTTANVAPGVHWTAGSQEVTIDLKGTGTTDIKITLILRGES